MASWLESLLSPAKTWVLSRRLRKYGNILNRYLKGIKSAAEIKPFPSLEEVEKIIGYRFNNHSLLDHAFTHPSYHKDCVSYERLEYVGDSVLNLLVAKEQFSMYPDLPPGLLTPLRAANVDTEKLARAAVQHNFHQYIRHGNPILKKRVASYLLKPMITPESLQTNAVKKLFEICQKYKLKVGLVDLWSQDGTYKVFVNNQLKGKGICHEKKEIALNRAANDAYNEVVRRMSMKNSK